MLGAIIGDIVGSRFEFNNYRAKDFEFFNKECEFTDDSVMTVALAKAVLECNKDYSNLNEVASKSMKELGRKYPSCGYGGHFGMWIMLDETESYGSFGNGAAMRVSSAGWAGNNLEEVKMISKKITEVTHDHPEGLKGAEAVACSIYLARTGSSMEEIKKFINENYYKMDFTIDSIRDSYEFNETCQETVPQAFEAFFESTSFEDAIRNAISLGGDSDTLGAITGSIAEAYYGVPNNLKENAKTYLDEYLLNIVNKFEKRYMTNII